MIFNDFYISRFLPYTPCFFLYHRPQNSCKQKHELLRGILSRKEYFKKKIKKKQKCKKKTANKQGRCMIHRVSSFHILKNATKSLKNSRKFKKNSRNFKKSKLLLLINKSLEFLFSKMYF